jgi:hypothetical protein
MTLPRTGRRDLLLQYPGRTDPTLSGPLDEARFRGHRGGIIARHRSLVVEPRTRGKLLSDGAMLLGVLVVWALLFDRVTIAWAVILDFWQAVFGMDGYVLRLEYQWGLRFPYLGFASGWPGPGLWIAGAVFTVALFVASFLVPRRFLPIASGLRVVAFFQACAQVFFAFWPEHFPYSGAGYVHGMLIAGLAFITLVPLLLGFTYYVFDVGWQRKLGLTLVIMLHLFVFVPLQFMAQAVLIYHLSVLFLPILFFVFGLPLDVLIFIGFYGWGASWKSRWPRDDRLEPARAAEAT